jgi:hypothetical protein
MAHFAKLDENNVVLEVVTLNNAVITDSSGGESEILGIEFLTQLYGWPFWRQTSYNSSFRKNYAGIGYVFDPVLDAFIPPKPYPSWLLNTDSCSWKAPIPYPEDGAPHTWDENTQTWA